MALSWISSPGTSIPLIKGTYRA